MKKILIITPHYPPSNLAAVHRSRLFSLHLPAFGWEPIILAGDEKYYEEALDWNLAALLPKNQRIEKVSAFPVTKPRLIGDIGLRAFFQLRKKALELVKSENIDFVYIPIPSFYVSLIGPYLKRKTGVKYGIDYIDPWVHHFPGSDQIFSRHNFSTKLAKLLEPMAVRTADIITGVADGYHQGVIQRNSHLLKQALLGAMPYGGEKSDHEKLSKLNIEPYLFKKNEKFTFVYAGAMLPKAYSLLEAIFQSIQQNKGVFTDIEFHFIGTGKLANDAESFNIKPYAEKYGLWNNIVFEYPKRIPYLDVLVHLEQASAAFILGSTEPHYTPSKTYQAVLSEKPIFAVLHEASTASQIVTDSNAGQCLTFNGEKEVSLVKSEFTNKIKSFREFASQYNAVQINQTLFEAYSAKSVTSKLVELLNQL